MKPEEGAGREARRWHGLAKWLSALLILASGATASVAATPSRSDPTGAVLQIETGVHAAAIRRLSVSADGRRLLTASDDKTARLWDLSDGKALGILRPRVGAGETGRLYGAAIHPTADLVAIGGSTRRILLHRHSDASLVSDFDAGTGDVRKLAWTPDGSLLFAVYAGENAVRAFDREGTLRHETRLPGPAYGLAVSANGLVAVTSFEGGVTVLRATGGQVREQARLVTADRQPVGVAFSPDGMRLVVGFNTPGAAPEIFDLASARAIARLEAPTLQEGNRMTVAWSADGSRIAVSGTGRRPPLGFPVFLHDARTLALIGQFDAARDSVLDLAPLDGKRFVFAAFDGSWGVIENDRVGLRVNPSIPDLRDPGGLRISADGTRVAWHLSYDRDPVSFDFPTRTLRLGPPDTGMKAASTSAGIFRRHTWQNVVEPVVAGTRITLEAGEISRALATFTEADDTMLATSRHLMRIGADGRVRWRARLAVEARAVVVAANDRLVVTGMADGSLRWWRSEDGTPILSLIATRDARWIAWTPAGYFDASTGADRLIGWAVNRANAPVADFHTVSRFRERFNRPADIDDALRSVAPRKPVNETADVPKIFPPVLERAAVDPVKRADRRWQIPFVLRNNATDAEVTVRIDGRPAPRANVSLGAVSGGVRHGVAVIDTPEAGALIQLLATSANGVSEPLTIATSTSAREFASPSAPAPSPAAPSPAAPPAGAAALPRLYVLAIGISKYQRPEYTLGLAAKDAGDFAGQLRKQGGQRYREVITRELVDSNATRSAVMAGLKWLSDTVTSEDVGIVFIAGHGINTKDGTYYFLPWEADLKTLAQSAVPESAFRSTLGKMRGKAILFVDTCYGGEALSRAGSSELSRVANDLSSEENGVIVFASSSSRQLSEENDAWGNGAFTKAAIEGLSGKADFNRSGRVTVKALDFYISEEVRRLTEGRQTPVSISPRGIPDFAIAGNRI